MRSGICVAVVAVLVAGMGGRAVGEGPTAVAVAGFERYVGGVEVRLAREHGEAGPGFLAEVSEGRVRRGELVVEELTPAGGMELPGALLHDWRGTAFVPGTTAEEFERVMRDFVGYPRTFAPEVLGARVEATDGDEMRVWMRVRQRHVIPVVMDTTYAVRFGRLDEWRGWSVSRSVRVEEIADAGTRRERVLGVSEEHGFLWRMNTYWSYEERDGGLYMQVESVSLTRGIPVGLGWVVRPFVESVPRGESVEFTLRSVCGALRR